MSLLQEIEDYMPGNQQEEQDKEQMIWFIKNHPDYLERTNRLAHFTASMWTVNKEHTKTLMVYHNLYDYGHGSADVRTVKKTYAQWRCASYRKKPV